MNAANEGAAWGRGLSRKKFPLEILGLALLKITIDNRMDVRDNRFSKGGDSDGAVGNRSEPEEGISSME